MSTCICRRGGNSLRAARGNFASLCPGVASRLSKWERSLSTNKASSPTPPVKKPVIFSGIQPTGVPHLGNYLGALRQWVKLQDEAEPGTKLLFSIVDLHALTVPQDAQQLRKWRREAFATLLAVGLDPKRSTIFYQSSVSRAHPLWLSKVHNYIDPIQVPAHTELMWILSTVASMGYLSRMTQWKVGILSAMQLPLRDID